MRVAEKGGKLRGQRKARESSGESRCGRLDDLHKRSEEREQLTSRNRTEREQLASRNRTERKQFVLSDQTVANSFREERSAELAEFW